MDNSIFLTGIIITFLLFPALVYITSTFKRYQSGIAKNGVEIKGVVRKTASANKGPVVRYVTLDNKEFTRQYHFYSSGMRGKYKNLEKISIIYDAKEPKHFWIVSDKTPQRVITLSTIASFITFAMGVVLIVIGF